MIRNNLPQLLSYKDMKALLDRQDPEYKKLADEICSSHISYPGLQAVLKLLLAERVSIRNLHLIIEAITEIAPHVRRTEQIVSMSVSAWRSRSAATFRKAERSRCCASATAGTSPSTRASSAMRRARYANSISIRAAGEFGQEATKAIRSHLNAGERFVLVTAPDARPYVRMIIERLFPTLPVLSMSRSPRASDPHPSARSRDHPARCLPG